MAKFFSTPFASAAAKATIPESDNASLSWKNGYTVFYEYDPTAKDSKAKHIERDGINTLFYEITSTIQALQLSGVAPYYDDVIVASGPGYPEGAVVSYGNKIWISKVAGNKIKPNATSTKNWEALLGYDSLVARLKKDGVIGGSGGGSSNTNGYTQQEIDDKLALLSSTMEEYLYKEVGEIFLLTWCDADRNADGFFLCNGEALPFTTGTVTSQKLFFGNQLYDLCYTTVNGKKTETDFKKQWGIVVNESSKTISLPNILTGAFDTQNVLLALGKTSNVTDTSKMKYFSSGEVTTEAQKQGNIVYQFTMLPCIYLGNYSEE